MPYVVDNGVGTFESDPARIAALLHRWLLGSPEERAAFAAMGER